jgi:hypothetical protein
MTPSCCVPCFGNQQTVLEHAGFVATLVTEAWTGSMIGLQYFAITNDQENAIANRLEVK